MKKVLFVFLTILLVVSGCSSPSSNNEADETIKELKNRVLEYNREVEELRAEKKSLEDKIINECNDKADHTFSSGAVISETVVKSDFDGRDLFVYTFRAFQSDEVHAFFSRKKLSYDKEKMYAFESDEHHEVVNFKLFDE